MSAPDFHLYLASASPRRAALLEQIGVRYRLIDGEVDEQVHAEESPADYVTRLAMAKAQAGRLALAPADPHPVLGADTSVVIDGQILGKPGSRDAALAMLRQLAGRCHEVYSAVALVGRQANAACTISQVCFGPLTQADLEAYWASGEPLGKAGAYAIQGLAAMFIERLQGSYSAVMGLPLFETRSLLLREGIDMLKAPNTTKGTGA
ncbi:MAG: Maf family protein [Gammaproteobacteria bacterium]